jgi:isopentenyl-diphosphate Delta-isomerase
MQRTSRKLEHLQNALRLQSQGLANFEEVRFVHNCIPESDFSQTSVATTIGELKLSSPIIINAMTGGAAETKETNRRLAVLAKEKGLAMAVGSQMAAIKDSSVTDSYTIVRDVNPDGIVFANLGAYASVEAAKQAVEMIEANALQLHLNVMQELIMPEGDRSFTRILEQIQAIVEAVPCPVIIKEVGFGMALDSAVKLAELGVQAIDVGGRGGTNFAKIENLRRELPFAMFDDWGQTTIQSLLELTALQENVDIIATGGIEDGLQIAKALSLGGSAVGMAGVFLRAVTRFSLNEQIEFVDRLHDQIRIAMTALGATTIKGLQNCPLIISGSSYHWATQRGIDCTKFAQRQRKGN